MVKYKVSYNKECGGRMLKLCMTNDIPDREARAFDTTAYGILFITQRDGQFFAYKNICPHLQIELEFLENEFLDQDKEFIQCSTHGALFQAETGECISGPCLGESLTVVPIQVHSDGGIYLA